VDSISKAKLDYYEQRINDWSASLAKSHEGGHFLPNEELYWTPLDKPIEECTIALVSSAGVHLRSQEAFDLLEPLGDPTIREIPGDVDSTELMASHAHVDTVPANEDINCVFPIDRLREFSEVGRIGKVASTHYGLMGFCPPVERMRDEVGTQIAKQLHEEGVDAVLLVAG
jgi:D-proline reductase (dithiol) PrdB